MAQAQDITATTWREELRATLALAWPLVIAQLAQMSLFTTDVIVMGWLGPEYLAAGTVATSYFHPFMVFGFGVLTAVSPLVAQALGRRDLRHVRRATRQGLWVALALVAVLIPLLWQVRLVFGWLGQTESTTLLAESFVHYAIWSFIPMMLFTVLRFFLSSHSDTRAVLWITLACVAFNALCNYVLVFGHWGFPRLELRGSGLSTTLANSLMLLLTLAYILRHRRYRRYHLFGRFWRTDWQQFRDILRLGLPIGFMLMIEVGLFAFAAMMMGWIGTAELAAHAVALQCAGIAFMIPLGLSQATTVRVGLAYGRLNRAGIHKAGWVSLVIGTGFMCCTCALFWLMPEPLISLFLDPANPENAQPFKLAITFLGVAALFQLADGAQVVSAAALRGLNDTRIPLFFALFGYWAVGFPIAYYCGFTLQMGGTGIWYGLASGLAVAAALLCGRFALRERFLLHTMGPL